MLFLWLLLQLSLLVSRTVEVTSVNPAIEGDENYIQTSVLADGEVVTKVRFNNITATQTAVADYRLQQMTNGSVYLAMWSISDQLVDCEMDTEDEVINEYLKGFVGQNESSVWQECGASSSPNETCISNSEDLNMTVTLRRINDLPSDLSILAHNEVLVEKCQKLHQQIRYKFMAITNKRWKRADLLVFPGTNWCGSGTKSKSFKELGSNAAADRCCRDHDHCKHTIAPFSSKYHLFNYRFHVVSHCDCDERFRSCLKLRNTGPTNLVGKLFFNIVQTKCFVFRSERTCKKRSWWGKCLKTRKTRKAYFRNGMSY